MYFPKHLAAIVVTLGLATTSLTGCGFHLRGAEATSLPQEYQLIKLQLPSNAQALEKPLTIYLSNFGAQVNPEQPTTILQIHNYDLRRQLMSGKLTEVQLRLSTSFSIKNAQGEVLTAPRTVITQRSYQYDIASVNTERQEENYLIKVMQDDIAQQIVRQLYANRLPAVQIDQAP